MQRVHKRASVWILAALVLSAASRADAQTMVITAKSATSLIDQLQALASAADPEQAKPATDALDRFRAPGALKGLDRSRPLGAFLDLPKEQGQPPSVVAFIPITDGKDFLTTLEQFGFGIDAKSGAPGFSHKITPPGGAGQDLFAVMTDDYAFFSLIPTGAEALKKLRPATLLPTRKGAGEIAVSIRLDRVPASYKDLVLQQTEQNLQKQRERKEGEKEADYKARMAGMKLVQDGYERVLREGREMSVDLDVSSNRGQLVLALNLDAPPGTILADALKQFGSKQSLFRGLEKGAAAGVRGIIPMAEPLRDTIRTGLEQSRRQLKDEKDPKGKELGTKLLDAIQPTLMSDELDLVINIYGPFPKKESDPTYVVLFGAGVKDGGKLEKTFREAAAQAKPEDRKELRLDVDRGSDGTAIHRVKVDPKGKRKDQFGDPLMFLSFRPDAVLAAVGENGLAVMKQALTAIGQPPSTRSAQMEASAYASRLSSMSEEKDREKTLAAAREVFQGKNEGKDHIDIGLIGINNGIRLRLAVDLPVLRFFTLVGAQKGK
jgi:hypothetical protein